MPPRFHAPHLTPDLTVLTLTPDESRHLSRVLRLRAGARVEVLDGRGLMYEATVTRPDPDATTLALGREVPAQPETPGPLVICTALLKGDAMDAVVRDATVLGATAIIPLTTARTNVPGHRIDAGRLQARWSRVTVAAAKQSGRAVLPDVGPVQSLDALLVEPRWTGWDRRCLVEPAVAAGDHDGAGTAALAPNLGAGPGPSTGLILTVGPEGGWADHEVDAARAAGWRLWSLGPCTLRAEQVTLAALAVVRYRWTLGEVP